MKHPEIPALAFILGALSSFGAAAQNDFSNVTITTIPVAGNIYMLMGQGGNIAVSVGEDGVLMVDDQFAPLAGKIQDAITELGGDSPRFILNTHWHGDHTGGNEEFSDEGVIIAHENVRLRLADPEAGRVPESLPVITFEDAVRVHINGEEVIARHYENPAHTDGDSVVHFTGSNVMHLGDMLFFKRFPFVDLNSGGSVAGLIKNLRAIQGSLPEGVKLIPGHGELTDAQGFNEYVQGVVTTVSLIAAKIDQGLSLERILAEGLPPEYASWGEGFISTEAWITSVYNSYTGTAP